MCRVFVCCFGVLNENQNCNNRAGLPPTQKEPSAYPRCCAGESAKNNHGAANIAAGRRPGVSPPLFPKKEKKSPWFSTSDLCCFPGKQSVRRVRVDGRQEQTTGVQAGITIHDKCVTTSTFASVNPDFHLMTFSGQRTYCSHLCRPRRVRQYHQTEHQSHQLDFFESNSAVL